MSFVVVAYFYHFLVHVAIVRLIAIKIFNRSAALIFFIFFPSPVFLYCSYSHLIASYSANLLRSLSAHWFSFQLINHLIAVLITSPVSLSLP